MDHGSAPWAVFLLLGPGEQTTARARDLFEALRIYERDAIPNCDVFLIDDGNRNVAELEPVLSRFRSVTVDANPARATTRLWDRMTAGTLTALRRITDRDSYAFALKLDADALVINPFSARLRSFFQAQPSVGVAGSYRSFPSGEENEGNRTLQHLILNAKRRFPTAKWLREWHRETPIRALLHLIAKYPGRRTVLERALAQGYRPADHVVGGAYAIGGPVLEAWRDASWFPRPLDFEWTLLSEDLLVAVCAAAAGFELADFNRHGEVFGVWWREPSMTPDELAAACFGIVHSVKEMPGFDEEAFRAWFRQRRSDLGR